MEVTKEGIPKQNKYSSRSKEKKKGYQRKRISEGLRTGWVKGEEELR